MANMTSVIKKLLIIGPLLAGGASSAAEFEVLDKLSVDGYTVLRGSADIPGGGFAVGESTFVVKNGKVGIGTVAPNSKLNVQSGTQWSGITLTNAAGTTVGYLVGTSAANDSGQLALNSGGVNQVSILASGNSYFSGGSVGIGTTAPLRALHVSGSLGVGGTAPGSWTSNGSDIFMNTGAASSTIQLRPNGEGSVVGSAIFSGGGVHQFFNASGVEQVRFNNGNVGIGTTGPAYKLDVAGTLNASSLRSSPEVSSFNVGGDFNTFYPVYFTEPRWSDGVTEIELTRSDVHTDSTWRGALQSKFMNHSTNCGHAASFINMDYNYYGTVPFIGGYQTAPGCNNGFVIWLRGGGTTYNYRSAKGLVNVQDYSTTSPKLAGGDWTVTAKTAIDAYVLAQGNSFTNNVYVGGSLKAASWAAQSLAGSGYANMGGLIIQWGSYTATMAHGSSYSPSFPIVFPNATLQVVQGVGNTVGTGTTVTYAPITAITTSGFTFQYGAVNGGTYATTVRYIAIGY